VRGKGLFHLADEWFTGGYQMYTKFDFVLRNYHTPIFENHGIMTLPLCPRLRPRSNDDFSGPLPALKELLE
jgi:hypothetical protein